MSGTKDSMISRIRSRIQGSFRYHTRPDQRGQTSLLLLAMLLGLFFRLHFALTAPMGLDEGSFLYDAQLMKEGSIAF